MKKQSLLLFIVLLCFPLLNKVKAELLVPVTNVPSLKQH